MKKLFLILLVVVSLGVQAQEQPQPAAEKTKVEMADTLRKEGKIYMVVAVVLAILVGLIVYAFLIDRKITRLERKLDDRQ